MFLIFFISSAIALTSPQLTSGKNPECPCEYKVAQAKYEIRLNLKFTYDQSKKVRAIEIYKNKKIYQKLLVKEMSFLHPSDSVRLLNPDLNQDGHPDIALETRRSANSNVYFDYWVYSPKEKKLNYLGNFPELNLKEGKLRSFEKSNGKTSVVSYEFKNDKLSPTKTKP